MKEPIFQIKHQNLTCATLIRLFVVILSFLFIPIAYSQDATNTSSAIASATIINEMLGVEKLDNINFQNIHAGSISLQQDLVQTNNAFVKIIGDEYEYSVTIPSTDITVQESVSLETMKIGAFTINYSADNENDKTLHITATLNVNNKQAAGTYSSITPLLIIVNNN